MSVVVHGVCMCACVYMKTTTVCKFKCVVCVCVHMSYTNNQQHFNVFTHPQAPLTNDTNIMSLVTSKLTSTHHQTHKSSVYENTLHSLQPLVVRKKRITNIGGSGSTFQATTTGPRTTVKLSISTQDLPRIGTKWAQTFSPIIKLYMD